MENKEIDLRFRCDFNISQPLLEEYGGRECQERCDIFVNKIPDIKNNYRVFCYNHQKIIDKINKQRSLEAQQNLKENICKRIDLWLSITDLLEKNYDKNTFKEILIMIKNNLNNGDFDD